jgi:uncharacterized integral membrane protein|uniref:LapA family protein n=1 Tax=Desulfobacca acetoxidans TaxID=60893 RepID=A0A7V6A3X0_9BACT
MTKVKALGFLVVGALLTIFIVQNWQQPNPPVQFLGYHILPLPQSVLILGFFLLGFLAGWVTHVFIVKKYRQEMPPEHPGES